MQELGYEST